jgi:iron complex outermembrane receptor protein
VIAGLNSADNNGNATFYATYRNVLPVLEGKYDWSACTLASGFLGTSGGPTRLGGKQRAFCLRRLGGNGFPTHFHQWQPPVRQRHVGPGGSLHRDRRSTTTARSITSSADERYTAGAFLHYDFNEHATVYENFMYMDDRTVAQIAPSGDFQHERRVQLLQPVSERGRARSLVRRKHGRNDEFGFYVLRRNVEGGGRQKPSSTRISAKCWE